jgi:hypothetical protein
VKARLAIVVAFAAAGATFSVPAHALVCGPVLETACETLCQLDHTLGRPCPR